MRLRRWWFAILCAGTVALLPINWAGSQEKAPATTKSTAKKADTETTKADDGKDVAALKTALKDLTDKLAKVESAAKAAPSKTDLDALKTKLAAAEEKAKAAEAAASKAVADFKAANTPDPKKVEEDKAKADEDKKKADADAKAVTDGITEAKVKGDTAWMLASSALVLLMVPGLALFYAGMVRRKNVLATMMQSMAALAVVGLYWVAFGYGLAFGPSQFMIPSFLGEGGALGWSWDLFFLKGIAADALLPNNNISVYTHVMFQGMFAIITPALISGAVAERIRFWPFCIFMLLWVTLVYCPLAHMVWAFDWFDPAVTPDQRGKAAIGFVGKMGALDFAGGTVVHIAAGIAGLACCLVLGKRGGYPKMVAHPNSMVLTLLGAGLLWFGWFGFNGGSATASNPLAASAFAATQAAAAAAGLSWMLIECLHKGKPTALGLASGIVAGLVAVTPAAGYVYIWGGAGIGALAGVVCYLVVAAKGALGYDDSLDAFGVHGVGGFLGAVLTGVFCYAAVNSAGAEGYMAYPDAKTKWEERITEIKTKELPAAGADEAAVTKLQDEAKGLQEKVDGGRMRQPLIQVKAAAFSVVFAFVVSLGLAGLVQAMTLGNFRTSKKDEAEGLDRTEHGEVGFDFSAATESVSVVSAEPKAATVPAGNGRYDVELAGADPGELMKVWSKLCQPSDQPADPDFLAVYPNVTTIRGTMFRCRGGDHAEVGKRLASLFRKHTGKDVKAVKVT